MGGRKRAAGAIEPDPSSPETRGSCSGPTNMPFDKAAELTCKNPETPIAGGQRTLTLNLIEALGSKAPLASRRQCTRKENMAIKRKGKIRVAIRSEAYWGYFGWVSKDQWEDKRIRSVDVEIVGCAWEKEDTIPRDLLTSVPANIDRY